MSEENFINTAYKSHIPKRPKHKKHKKYREKRTETKFRIPVFVVCEGVVLFSLILQMMPPDGGG